MKRYQSFFSILFLILVILTTGLVSTAVAQKDSTAIRKLLEQRDHQIKQLLGPKGTEYTKEKRDKLKDIINGIIDYSAMAEYALQQTYDTLSSEKRREFTDLFATIVRDQSLNDLNIYRAEVTYNRIKVKDDSAVVHTTVTMDRVRTPVIYKMKYRKDKQQWVVVDMIIDDVSTAESYRRQFQNIIRKKGFQYLMEVLRKRAGS